MKTISWKHENTWKQLQSCYNKLVVSIEELSTPVDPAVLDNPPTTIKEHNLLCQTISVWIPSPVMRLRLLTPWISHPKSLTSCKVKELSDILVHSSRHGDQQMSYLLPYQLQLIHWNPPRLEEYLAWGTYEPHSHAWHIMHPSWWDHLPQSEHMQRPGKRHPRSDKSFVS